MSIEVGDSLPKDILVYRMADNGPVSITTQELFQDQRVVLFAVPGAFTPTCSEAHLPGFVVMADQFKQAGVDRVICISVNDAFVMGAWAKQQNADELDMLADGNADLVSALGLAMDASGRGMGTRSRRFALIADDGVVRWLGVEAPGEFEKSSADSVMAALNRL